MSNITSSPARYQKKDRDRALSLAKSHIKRALPDLTGLQKRPTSPKNLNSPSSFQPSLILESPSSSRCSSNGANTPVTDDQSALGVESITVLVRTRPLNDQEKLDASSGECLRVDESSSVVTLKPLATSIYRPGAGPYSFKFDHALGGDCPQSDVFGMVGREACDHFLDGFNVAIFAYGQTGAGKTYTMYGELKGCQGAGELNQRAGLVPRSLAHIFEAVQALRQRCAKVAFCVSLIEIYNESVMDLLCNDGRSLSVREDALRDRTFVDGAVALEVFDVRQCMDLLHRGAMNRTVGATAMNKESSRSHSVFTLSLDVEDRDPETGAALLRQSQFHLIDLAGSERQKHSKVMGRHLREAGSINRSLTVLGKVIMALAAGSKHVPYRDSKLTFLLKNSIGGNSKTYLIANVSPSHKCHDETLSTLKFASFAKKPIKYVSRNVTNADVTIEDLKKEIRRLKAELCDGRIHQDQGGDVRAALALHRGGLEVEALWRESVEREAGLRAKLGEERQHFRARLDEYERLCHSLEQCLQSSKLIIKFKDQKLRDAVPALRGGAAALPSPLASHLFAALPSSPHVPSSLPAHPLALRAALAAHAAQHSAPASLAQSPQTIRPLPDPPPDSLSDPRPPSAFAPVSDPPPGGQLPPDPDPEGGSWGAHLHGRLSPQEAQLELAHLRIRRLEDELAACRDKGEQSAEEDDGPNREVQRLLQRVHELESRGGGERGGEGDGGGLEDRLAEAFSKLEEERRAHISALDLVLEVRESEERAKQKLQHRAHEMARMAEERFAMERRLDRMRRVLLAHGLLQEAEAADEAEEEAEEEEDAEAGAQWHVHGLIHVPHPPGHAAEEGGVEELTDAGPGRPGSGSEAQLQRRLEEIGLEAEIGAEIGAEAEGGAGSGAGGGGLEEQLVALRLELVRVRQDRDRLGEQLRAMTAAGAVPGAVPGGRASSPPRSAHPTADATRPAPDRRPPPPASPPRAAGRPGPQAPTPAAGVGLGAGGSEAGGDGGGGGGAGGRGAGLGEEAVKDRIAAIEQARIKAERELESAQALLARARAEAEQQRAARAEAELAAERARAEAERVQDELRHEIQLLRDAEEEWILSLQEAQARADAALR